MKRRNRSTFPDWSALLALLTVLFVCGAGVIPAQAGVAYLTPAWGSGFHPGYAMVDCDLDPEEALVILDGEVLGEADDFDGFPSYLFVRPGAHTLEFRAEGYQPLMVRGTFRSGAFIRVDRELGIGDAPLLVELETTENQDQMVERSHEPPPVLPPDDGPAGPQANQPSRAEERATGNQAVNQAGYLRLKVIPGDAAVYIDDRFIGTGDEISRLHGALRLATGEHTIQVIRPGFVNRILQHLVIDGEHQQLDVWLESANPD